MLAAILVVALAVRLAAIVATPNYQPIFDSADFERHAQSLASGHGYPAPQLGLPGPSAFRPPMYPLALAAVVKLGGGLTAQRGLSTILGVLTVLLMFMISRRIWGPRVALVTAAIGSVFPPLVVFGASILSETLFIPLVLSATWAVLQYRREMRVRWAVAAGIAFGLAVLTRTSGLPALIALVAGVWLGRPLLARSSLVAPLALTLAAVVAIAPWSIRNTLDFHRFVPLGTGAGYALAGTYNGEARADGPHPGEPRAPNELRTFRDLFAHRNTDEATFVGRFNHRALTYIRSHPGYVVETVAWNVPRVLDVIRRGSFHSSFMGLELQATGVQAIDSAPVFLGSLYLVLVLAVVGIGAQVTRRPSVRAPWFLWGVPLLLLLPVLAIYGLPRYRAPIDPFIVILGAIGLSAIFQRMWSDRRDTVS